jgi:hypothetical protein
VATRIPGL